MEKQFEDPIDEAVINYVRADDGAYLTVKVSRRKTYAYRITRGQ